MRNGTRPMRPDRAYRMWIAIASGLSFASGVALWAAGEHAFALCGLAAGTFHMLWGLDLPALVRGRLRRRAIVIPRLQPMGASPPHRTLAQRLRALRGQHG